MKGTSTSKDLNILSEQLGKDAVSRVHRLELENQRLIKELEAAKTRMDRVVASEVEAETRRVSANLVRLEEQVNNVLIIKKLY